MAIRLEIACFNEEAVYTAVQCKADRIELCERYDLGGVTPSDELIAKTVTLTEQALPVNIIVRPRGGNFTFTSDEFQQMKQTILDHKDKGIGFVFGVLQDDGTIDIKRTGELVRAASSAPCTFHRAFDEVDDKNEALEDVINSGCSALLTSAGAGQASQNLAILNNLIIQAGDRIEIIVGGSVRSSNLPAILEHVHPPWCHTSAITDNRPFPDPDEIAQIRSIIDQSSHNQSLGKS